jgi:hypothetical protein
VPQVDGGIGLAAGVERVVKEAVVGDEAAVFGGQNGTYDAALSARAPYQGQRGTRFGYRILMNASRFVAGTPPPDRCPKF